jgi:hypothetical protein
VLGAFVGVVALHALWDGMQELALTLGSAATGRPDGGALANTFYTGGLVVVAVAGLASLGLTLRRYDTESRRTQPEARSGETPRM